MNQYRKIFKAFLAYCYGNLDNLQWKSFRNKEDSFRYYRTKINDLQVIVGLSLERDKYFMSIQGLGEVGNKSHRMFFPSKLQRLFLTLHQLEKNTRYEQSDPEPHQGTPANG